MIATTSPTNTWTSAAGHDGRYFKVPGVHLSEPSPQRTPVLYQAGASARGRSFAGEHAECVFIATPSKSRSQASPWRRSAKAVQPCRSRSAERAHLQFCRPSSSMRLTPRPKRNARDYKQYINLDGALALGSRLDGNRLRPLLNLRRASTPHRDQRCSIIGRSVFQRRPQQNLDCARAGGMDRHQGSGATRLVGGP